MNIFVSMKHPILIISFLSIGINFLFAQNRSSFSETQNIDRLSTLSITYEFIQNKKDTILDGLFTVESLVRNKGIDSSGTFEGFSMEYKKGKPEGQFTYSMMEFSPSSFSAFSNYQVTRKLNGLSWETHGQIKNNKPFQSWVANGRKIKESEVIENFGRYSIQFNNGFLSGNFTFSDSIQNIFINGTFGANNLLDKVIAFQGKQPFELHFENGILTKLVVDSLVVFSQTYFEDLSSSKPTPLSESFESYLHTLIKIVRAKTSNTELTFDYDEAIKKILYMVNAFEIVTGSKPMTRNLSHTPIPLVRPLVKLPIYPKSKQEESSYESFHNSALSFVKTCDSMIAIPAFSLSAFNNFEITRLFQKLKMIRNAAFTFNGIVAELNTDEFIHFDRLNYLQTKLNYYFSGNKKNQFEFDSEKHQVKLSYPDYDSSKSALENAKDILSYLEKELDLVGSQVTEKMRNVKSEERLKDNETQISQLANSIDNILDNFEFLIYNGATTRKLIDAIENQKKRIILTYTSTAKRQKTSAGEEAIRCLSALEQILLSFPALQEREKAIYDAFHENELNPVTWTRMETTLHERLFNAYQEKLIPFAISQIEKFENENCLTFEAIFNNISAIQNYMLKTAEENPGRINRKIRNSDSVEIILSKIELNLAQ